MSRLFGWITWYQALAQIGIIALALYFMRQIYRFVTKHGQTVINALFWVLTRVVTRSISAQLSMRRYCRNQLASDIGGKFLQVPGLKGRALEVDTVFVPLTLELGGCEETFTNANLLDAGSRLMVVGDPGSGKTTLIKRVFRESCRTTSSAPRRGRLPIRVELKSLAPPHLENDSEAGDWLFGQLRWAVQQVEAFDMPQLFDSWCTNAGLIVLLDGLDEVSSERYMSVAAALRGISQKLSGMSSNNSIIVTMRIQFHQQVRSQFMDSYPQTLYVRPFTPNEIYTFLRRWPFEGGSEEAKINKIYADLTDRPTLREMCTNPLVLAMYVESDRETVPGELPNTRTEFYDKVVDELLIRRRDRQQAINRGSGALRRQREAILGKLAFDNLADSDQAVNSLSWKKAVADAQDVWKCSEVEAESRLRELASETGLISEERPGESFRFIHQTFCEFLAAIESTRGRKGGWSELIDTHRKFTGSGEAQLQSRLIEVIPFAHALLPPIDRPEALVDVCSLNDRLVLGRCFLETQLYDQREWIDYLQHERDYLADENVRQWNENKLRRLHLFSVVVRDARDWSKEIERKDVSADLDGIFSSIVRNNRETIATIFATYARQDAAAAVRLAEHVGVNMLVEYPGILVASCQEEPFIALALARAESPDPGWSAVLAEAGLRFDNVAKRLDSTPGPDTALSPDIIRNRRIKHLLRLCAVKPESWYSILLRRSFGEEDYDADSFPAIKAVAACANRVYMHRALSYGAPLIALTACFLLAACEAPFMPQHPTGWSAFICDAVVVIQLAVLSLLGIMFSILLRAIYQAIGNCRPSPPDDSVFVRAVVHRTEWFIRIAMPAQVAAINILLALGVNSTATRSLTIFGHETIHPERLDYQSVEN